MGSSRQEKRKEYIKELEQYRIALQAELFDELTPFKSKPHIDGIGKVFIYSIKFERDKEEYYDLRDSILNVFGHECSDERPIDSAEVMSQSEVKNVYGFGKEQATVGGPFYRVKSEGEEYFCTLGEVYKAGGRYKQRRLGLTDNDQRIADAAANTWINR